MTPDNTRTSSENNNTDLEQFQRIRAKNRRKRYLDTHPEYFETALELADPLLYDRLIRRFQTPAEREAERRSKGFSGILEADLLRSEARLDASKEKSSTACKVRRKPSIANTIDEHPEDAPKTKEEGKERWLYEMTMRFIRGDDDDFDYKGVDESEEFDDRDEEIREEEERYFEQEEPEWVLEEPGTSGEKSKLTGETGIQDF
ncbi:hypothetical protein M501DRAFT_925616 [Patellaria atrata CBS 101060]|uniref:CCD97-like C-terminal domain-containing protein n=1 Tax=Patellaria atrata CBS 101060 TaxID=1346257 RepID=A0A9P4SID0_9PEZI|nr:hypothetical protein M501DRAFT_925616 [Patellaria atrata CBS 101060]